MHASSGTKGEHLHSDNSCPSAKPERCSLAPLDTHHTHTKYTVLALFNVYTNHTTFKLQQTQISKKQFASYRAANPSLDLSIAKSDFKHSNTILSVVYIYIWSSFAIAFAETCDRIDAMISCRNSDVLHYKEICEKHLHLNYVHML